MRRNRIGLLLMAVVLSRTSPAFAFVFRHSVVSISINVNINININRSCHRNCNTIACKSPQALLRSAATYGRRSFCDIMGDGNGGHRTKKRPLSAASEEASEATGDNDSEPPPLYLEEGLFAVTKPLGWTSQDVVGKIRFVLEKDARERGAPDRRTKKRRPWMKVGHGGTLDPLATGVLVCGVGSGTKDLQKYLVGSKQYRAEVTLGYQTTTLDADPKGEVVEEKSFDHVVSYDEIDAMLQSKFTGTIQQVPPIFSALKRDGKKLYELGRKGQTAEEIKIEAREVVIHDLKLIRPDRSGDSDSDAASEPPRIEKFEIEVECGGGTYIRSLVRDIGIELGTVATMTALERTKQGRFLPEHCIPYQLLGDEPKEQKTQGSDEKTGTVFIDKKEDCNWTVETITEGIRVCRSNVLGSSDDDDDGLK